MAAQLLGFDYRNVYNAKRTIKRKRAMKIFILATVGVTYYLSVIQFHHATEYKVPPTRF